MPHQDGRDVVPNQPIPRRAGAPASGRHDQSSSWTVKTSAASGHDGTAVRLGGEIHGGPNGRPSGQWASPAPQTPATAGATFLTPSPRSSRTTPTGPRLQARDTWGEPPAAYAACRATPAWPAP